MSSTTPKLNLYVPAVGDGEDNSQTWGTQMNANLQTLDDVVGTTTQRATAAASTGALAAGATASVNVSLAKTSDILNLATNYPAWVRVYSTAAARTADASRPITQDPVPGAGVVLEVLTSSLQLSIPMSPVPSFANGDGTPGPTAYLSITNMDTVSRSITATLTHLPQEV